MTTKELLELQEKLTSEAREIMAAKNHDYAGASGDTPFANFEACEKLGICSTEEGILVRLLDKFMRQANFVKSGHFQVKDEGFLDTVKDSINYEVILAGVMIQKGRINGESDES